MPYIIRKTKWNILLIWAGLFILFVSLVSITIQTWNDFIKNILLLVIFIPMWIFMNIFGLTNFLNYLQVDTNSIIIKSLFGTKQIDWSMINKIEVVDLWVELETRKTKSLFLVIDSNNQLPLKTLESYFDLTMKMIKLYSTFATKPLPSEFFAKFEEYRKNYSWKYILTPLSSEDGHTKIISWYNDEYLLAKLKECWWTKAKDLDEIISLK